MADQVTRFLDKIAQLESSGGSNVEHSPAIKGGPNKGQTAVGRYGLMPNTIAEVASRASMPEAQMSPEEIAKKVETDPQFEEKIAKNLASIVLSRSGGNEEKAAYSWLMGHNIDPTQITDEQLKSSEYVQKYKELKVPQDVEYKDNPQVNPPPREKGILERIKDSISSISIDPDEARAKHNAMIASLLTRVDPNLSKEEALAQAKRMTDLSEQAGTMSGGIADVGRDAARKAIGALRSSRIKSYTKDPDMFGKPAVAEETATVMNEFTTRNKGGIGNDLPKSAPRLVERPSNAYQGVISESLQEPGIYESAPAVSDEMISKLEALKRIREGR